MTATTFPSTADLARARLSGISDGALATMVDRDLFGLGLDAVDEQYRRAHETRRTALLRGTPTGPATPASRIQDGNLVCIAGYGYLTIRRHLTVHGLVHFAVSRVDMTTGATTGETFELRLPVAETVLLVTEDTAHAAPYVSQAA